MGRGFKASGYYVSGYSRAPFLKVLYGFTVSGYHNGLVKLYYKGLYQDSLGARQLQDFTLRAWVLRLLGFGVVLVTGS